MLAFLALLVWLAVPIRGKGTLTTLTSKSWRVTITSPPIRFRQRWRLVRLVGGLMARERDAREVRVFDDGGRTLRLVVSDLSEDASSPR
jgi:hypothetical protein